MDNAGNADLSVANSVFAYCLNTAGHEPLDQAAAAFAALGLFFAGAPPAEQAYTMTHATIQFKLGEVNEAMRRPGLLQRADELVPHTVARVLLAMAATVEDHVDGFSAVAEPTVTGALQLLHYGATLASRPHGPNTMRIQNCASLALAHVCLPESLPRSLTQADLKLLQSQEYLKAVLQLAAHVQTLKDKEHRLLGKSMVPMAERDPQACWIGHASSLDTAPDETVIVPVLCYAQVRMLEMAWILVNRRMKQGRLHVVSREIADAVVNVYGQIANFDADLPAPISYQYTGALSDGRPLLMAVAPAATAKVKAAAAAAMAAGLSAALRPDGMVNNMLKEGYMLQWRAVHCMAYMAALDAVCGATSAAHLMAYDALLQSWNAAGATLQFCTKWLNDPKTLQRVSTYLPAQFEVVDPATQPRFARNTIFDDVSEAIAKAIQLLHRSVSQMAFPDDEMVVGTMISMLPNDTITGIMASCVRLPIFSFATPKTRFVGKEDMLLMRGHWQLADMHFERVFCTAGAPCVNDTILRGFSELSAISLTFAVDWPDIYMDLKILAVLMDALMFVAELEDRALNKTKLGDVAECCKRLCAAVSIVAAASHGPCALVKSTSELVYGVPAVEAVDQLRHVQDSLSALQARMSPELAEQLRDSFLDVERTVVESLPPISSNMSRKLLAAAVTSAGTCDCDRCQRFAAAAEVNNSRFAARRAALAEKAARQEQATAAEPAQLSPEQQQQASAAADRMAQLLLEEEDAAAAAKSAKQARKKARKKAAKAATLPTDSPQQRSATDDTHTQEATAAGQSSRVGADASAGAPPDPQPSSHSDAAASSATAPTDAGNEPDDSWQMCPLSKARMRDPVIASDSVCYERVAIEEWVAEHGAVSPMTKKAITADLIPNHSLRSLLQALQQRS